MRKIIMLAVAATALTAVPAAAQERKGEARAEVRGGVAWAQGDSEAFAGAAIGYDFDLGESTFLGFEFAGDKVLQKGADVFFTAAGRFGVKVGTGGRVYALGGYGVTKGEDAPFAGAGFQLKFGERVYGKVEYRRTIDNGPDVNFGGAGLGLTF